MSLRLSPSSSATSQSEITTLLSARDSAHAAHKNPGSTRGDDIPARQRVGRNEPCPCGSGGKFKRCCLTRSSGGASTEGSSPLPAWLNTSPRKLHKFERYATKVYSLPRLLDSLKDGRRAPENPTLDVVTTLYHAALFRRPSINAIEGDLKQPDHQAVVGRKPTPGTKAFSAEVIYNTLDKMDVTGVREAIEDVVWSGERNKAFREGYGSLRCVAIDGWEPFSSYHRHCSGCLTREIKVKNPKTGDVEKHTQYYHRYAVAMLIGPVLDVVLDIEPVRSAEARTDLGEDAGHEGELTAAHRLIDRLRKNFGSFIDVVVLDALYANGPVMTKLDAYGYGGLIVLKKNDNEPLKEALSLWEGQGPCQSLYDEDSKEAIDLWDVDDIDTLESYKGKVRVIRAEVTKGKGSRSTWCFALVGKARKLGRRTALCAVRARWHIENTAFAQWVKYWNLGRVFRHTANAVLALLLVWMLVFNLLQLFVYRRLGRPRNPKDPCDTIISIVAEMFRDLGSLREPIPWRKLADATRG